MKKIMGICDQDNSYAGLLSENLGKRDSFPLEISTFENVTQLKKAIGNRIISVLLISETMYIRLIEQNYNINMRDEVKFIVLNEGLETDNSLPKVWKYQSAENIRKEILGVISECDNISINTFENGSRHAKIIGFYSPYHERAESSFILTLGKIMSKDNKVMVLSYKENSGIKKYMGDRKGRGEKDITDLIYYYRSGDDKFMYSFEASIVSSLANAFGVDLITPAYSFLDVKAVKSEDWIGVMELLRKKGNYDYILLELSTLDDGLPDILRKCDLIVSLCRENEKEGHVMGDFIDLLKDLDYEDVVSRINVCSVPENVDVPKEVSDVLRSSFGEYVRKEYEDIKSASI